VKQLTKTTSDVTGSLLIADAPRADEILLACLHGVEAMSAHLLSDLALDPAKGAQRHDSLASRIQTLLEKKFSHIIKQFLKAGSETLFRQHAGLTRIARLREAEFRTTELKLAEEQQALLERIDLLERKLADAETFVTHELAWAPLVKASAMPAIAHITASTPDGNTCDEKKISHSASSDLAGRQILCVGGRAKLYPEYQRLIETSGGSLLIYRNGSQNGLDHLPALLARADMVVCPVDCVNHHTYFTVKRYCKRSGKACVLLDRSGLPTFRKGVAVLAALVASPVAEETCSGA
jgi:hypothetical protein